MTTLSMTETSNSREKSKMLYAIVSITARQKARGHTSMVAGLSVNAYVRRCCGGRWQSKPGLLRTSGGWAEGHRVSKIRRLISENTLSNSDGRRVARRAPPGPRRGWPQLSVPLGRVLPDKIVCKPCLLEHSDDSPHFTIL